MNKKILIITLVLGLLALIVALLIYNRDMNVDSGEQADSIMEFSEVELQELNKNENMNEQKEVEFKIKTIKEGDGLEAVNGKTVFVHYTGRLENGNIFDSSIERGVPFDFVLGAGMVIQGWEKGVLGMKVGEKRTLTVPADMGYGDREITGPDGSVIIPKNATLIFDVLLLDVK